MRYYPIFLRVHGRRCGVIGGGEVAERKTLSLLAAGASVTVISPRVTEELARRARMGEIEHWNRRYRTGDVRGFFLAYAATNDDALHAEIAREAAASGVLLNVVDRPELCTFIVPAVMTRGDLTVAVSTGGGSPALAKQVRETIAAVLGPEYETALDLLSRIRERLGSLALPSSERQRILRDLVASELLEYVRIGDAAGINRVLTCHVGNGVSLATLGVRLEDGRIDPNRETAGKVM